MEENTNLEIDKKKAQEQELLVKREARRKRRQRNQILAYLGLFLFLIVVGVAGFAGFKYYEEWKGQQEDIKQEVVSGNIEEIDTIIDNEGEIVIPTPAPTIIPTPSPEEKLDEIIDSAIAVMPLEDKVAGLFIVTPESITGVSRAVKAGDGTRDALTKWAVGGLIYTERNMQSAEQFTEMLANTSLYSRYPLFLGVEEEGGANGCVAAAELAAEVSSAAEIGTTADPAKAYEAGAAIAGYLSGYGFNLNFAPVADINNAEGSIAANSAYGSDVSLVNSMVVSMIQGLEENGISSCMKHFPGVGSSTKDAADGLAVTERTAEQFRTEEFTVFSAGIDAGVDFVMVSNVAVPAFTGDNTPCTMSEEVVTNILRNELGFNGVIITDDMSMKAISDYYGADEAAIMALKAGCDMILMPENFEMAYNGVLEAVQNGTISEERINDALRRIYRIKFADKLEE